MSLWSKSFLLRKTTILLSVVFFFALFGGEAAAQKKFAKVYPAGQNVRLKLMNRTGTVTVEGWKLVTGKFIHSELRNGAVGCYLFKRSQKRRLSMNNPWQDPRVVS